jgi:nicotinamide-nucleotide amidase
LPAGVSGPKLPRVEIELINTGSELLLGRVLNTHQQWICRRLADFGHKVTRQVAVPDTARDIQQAVREALSRADFVIVTGGLGPTSDDITRDLIAQLLGKKLIRDEKVFTHIKNYFAARKRPMPAHNDVQAMVPEGAEVLWNPNGTAPGLVMAIGSGVQGLASGEPSAPYPRARTPSPKWLVMLPGPPRELRPMFDDFVTPVLRREFPLETPFVCRTLRTGGIGESSVQEKIQSPLAALVAEGLEVGYCARVGQVDLRLSARCADAGAIVRAAETIVKKILSANIFGFDDEEIEQIVVRLLTERKKTLALAESCTGGCIANRVTNVPGASAVFLGGVVSYANSAKETLLGVRPETLQQHGAVSEAVAREMADGAREKFGADFTIAVTGIAGPAGGTTEKPVGTVFIALAGPSRTVIERKLNVYEREAFKQLTANQSFELLLSSFTQK